ncbi:potassium-transporting ATPase subunit KdpB [Rivularia sp. UHCC 0363]|uniref:potassium-transporting ATPase subunit KdpB n=1 Tax=Rivularia sp. UHCC 0363 TaxID=3110244 RepID=UPI002B2081F8|nr:potassium-transporting ATPase subunit KdpB [Rivularia sp. UHCC 0363]MEA5593860.1 potassium-transporting ATPase subunit KdpB [Rivularia sp. UHCC 0363]
MNPVATTSKSNLATTRPNERRFSRKKVKASKKGLYRRAIRDAFVKLNPKHIIKNPVLFVVWVSCLIVLTATIFPALFGSPATNDARFFNGAIAFVLFLTLWLANFAEAFAQSRGKAQADVLRSIKSDIKTKKLLADGTILEVTATSLQRGDTVYVVAGDIIPADGEVIMGAASVDEGAITGESIPVLKESGSDLASFVTGGSRIISDELIVRITVDPDKGFINRMIYLIESRERKKTPLEATLTVLMALISLMFLSVVTTFPALAYYIKTTISVPILIAIFVALIPTTFASLLSATTIGGMDRIAQLNLIATSARAIEACGDINTLILDKTGTVTRGNRLADGFIPINGHTMQEIADVALAASVFDDTSEGKSIIRLAQRLGARIDFDYENAQPVKFTAMTRIGGTDLPNGSMARKGAVDEVKSFVRSLGAGEETSELNSAYEMVSQQGGTPLAVSMNREIYGIIYLKDNIKPGIRERFGQLRRLGVRTIMITGDNRITTSVIARETGIEEFIAEATPEDKIAVVQREQAEGKLVAMTGDGTNDAAALAQANVAVAMNNGTQAAKEAANIIDLDSDPTKLIDIIGIGKQVLMTRGALTTFSIANNIGKYLAIIPVIFASPGLNKLNIMNLTSTNSAVLSVLIYNALIIPALIPLALRGVPFTPMTPNQLLQRNLLIYGIAGLIIPFLFIKLIDLIISLTVLA